MESTGIGAPARPPIKLGAPETSVVPSTTEIPEGSKRAASEALPIEAGPEESGGSAWPDESAEAAFLADARERGETVVAVKSGEEPPEETDGKALPPLDELVKRISPEIRETLEDLFRARFVAVKRLPRKAFKA